MLTETEPFQDKQVEFLRRHNYTEIIQTPQLVSLCTLERNASGYGFNYGIQYFKENLQQ
jgi:hypothetical protein